MNIEVLSKKLSNLREQKGWSQQELATILNTTAYRISEWECGVSVPDNEYLKKYSEIFCLSVDYFVDKSTGLEYAIDYDKIELPKRDKRCTYASAIFWGSLYAVFIIGSFIGFFFIPNESIPVWGKVLWAIIPTIIMVTIIVVTIQRIKEIKGGEEDDSSKY